MYTGIKTISSFATVSVACQDCVLMIAQSDYQTQIPELYEVSHRTISEQLNTVSMQT